MTLTFKLSHVKAKFKDYKDDSIIFELRKSCVLKVVLVGLFIPTKLYALNSLKNIVVF